MAQTHSKQKIQSALAAFQTGNLSQNAIALFETLGYNTTRQQPFEQKTYAYFNEYYVSDNSNFNAETAKVTQWQSIDLLFQLSKDEVSDQHNIFGTHQVEQTIIESYLFFALELGGQALPDSQAKPDLHYTRTDLAQISREINKVFSMPVMVLFKHGDSMTLSLINRRQHKKDAQKDVLEKITLIKDIALENPHRAHIDILSDLSFTEIKRVYKVSNFVELHNAWQKVLDTKELNKKFYKELSQWYFWAIKEVVFPMASFDADDLFNETQNDKVREHNAKNLIRLLTRILFVWFIKEKNLIPDELFDENYIKTHLIKDFDPHKEKNYNATTQRSEYYRAILQNLFFATLNQTAGKREFRKDKQHRNVTNLMRYESYFKDPQAFLKLVETTVPFMNGGLFECLDKPDPQLKGKQGGDVILYEDGFSDRPDNLLRVPDYIFFDGDQHADLSDELGDKKQKDVPIKGLINILNAYKFTVTENTPIEEDIALDPELLGQVFENLLASYNPETKTTARKQTGSFYTPREIVDYMVDESLIAYLAGGQALPDSGEACAPKIDNLRSLLSYNNLLNPFTETETTQLINAIDTCKILDPACGSGAFPMGILHKLVHCLHKLDPDNKQWQAVQRAKILHDTQAAMSIEDNKELSDKLKELNNTFDKNVNHPDYARKLFLIENCIYGVDIQPIAIQISKLRFFISLVVDQIVNPDKNNFGILPLPNLETKFVAANTLIGIDRPQAQSSVFANPDVNTLEEQLKDVRHRLFSAKTPATKRKLREADKNLREKMGDLLTDSGWDNNTARQLAAWDPYDQNTGSPFFDAEWMFGLSKGFDVVIGNPPYGVSIKDKYRTDVVKHLGNVPDYEIYYYFIEAAHILLKDGGVNSFIIPNTFLFNVFAEKYRKKLIQNWSIECVIDCTAFKIFDAATIFNAITVFVKDENGNSKIGYKPTNDTLDFSELSSRKTMFLSKDDILDNNKNWGLLFKLGGSVLQIISKIKKSSLALNELFPEYSQGLIAYDKYQGQSKETIKNRIYHYSSNEKESLRKFLWGEDVIKYCVSWNGKEWIDYCDGIANPRQPKFFKGNRILIREITNPSIFAAYTDEELYHDPSIIVVLNNDCDSAKFLLAILNSRLASFYHFNSSPKATKGAFPKILVTDIKNFPIPKLSSDQQQPFIELVDKILALKKQNPAADTKALEAQIDTLVYALYELTAEEISIIEGKSE